MTPKQHTSMVKVEVNKQTDLKITAGQYFTWWPYFFKTYRNKFKIKKMTNKTAQPTDLKTELQG